MSEDQINPMLDRMRETYNAPGETPREEMWEVISARIGETSAGGTEIIDLQAARERRDMRPSPAMGWAVAAAAVLVLGIGIGRMTAPNGTVTPVADGEVVAEPSVALAAQEHLGQSESLLTMVRADARAGRVDPATAEWAKAMLWQTRLLLDSEVSVEPALTELLLDLELVLVQVVGVAETGSTDEARARTELELALRSLEEGEVLPRIQAVLPNGVSGA